MSSRRNRVRNRRRKRRPDRWMIFAQIALLVTGVLFLYLFGDEIAAGAGNLVSELTDSPRTDRKAASPGADAEGGTPGRGAPSLEVPPTDTGRASADGEVDSERTGDVTADADR